MSFEKKARGESYSSVLEELTPRQREALEQLKISPRGLTAWDIADRTGRLVHAVRPRLTELRDAGIIRSIGTRVYMATGRPEAIWILNQTGQQLLFSESE